MKKILLLIVLGLTFSTTACGHKKRVVKLEDELTRCREKKASLSEAPVTAPPAVVVAQAD